LAAFTKWGSFEAEGTHINMSKRRTRD